METLKISNFDHSSYIFSIISLLVPCILSGQGTTTYSNSNSNEMVVSC